MEKTPSFGRQWPRVYGGARLPPLRCVPLWPRKPRRGTVRKTSSDNNIRKKLRFPRRSFAIYSEQTTTTTIGVVRHHATAPLPPLRFLPFGWLRRLRSSRALCHRPSRRQFTRARVVVRTRATVCERSRVLFFFVWRCRSTIATARYCHSSCACVRRMWNACGREERFCAWKKMGKITITLTGDERTMTAKGKATGNYDFQPFPTS